MVGGEPGEQRHPYQQVPGAAGGMGKGPHGRVGRAGLARQRPHHAQDLGVEPQQEAARPRRGLALGEGRGLRPGVSDPREDRRQVAPAEALARRRREGVEAPVRGGGGGHPVAAGLDHDAEGAAAASRHRPRHAVPVAGGAGPLGEREPLAPPRGLDGGRREGPAHARRRPRKPRRALAPEGSRARWRRRPDLVERRGGPGRVQPLGRERPDVVLAAEGGGLGARGAVVGVGRAVAGVGLKGREVGIPVDPARDVEAGAGRALDSGLRQHPPDGAGDAAGADGVVHAVPQCLSSSGPAQPATPLPNRVRAARARPEATPFPYW